MKISADVHYFEIKINHIKDTNDVMIGVTPASRILKDSSSRARCYDKIWGWHCTCGRKMRPKPDGKYENCGDYGSYAKIGDVVGCIL